MWDHRNSIVHERIEEFLNYKESNKLEEKLIRSCIEGYHNVIKKHWYMFDENLDNILNQSVREK